MSSINRLNELADFWAFVVGHMALQAGVVAAVLVILVVWGKRWPAQIRHGLLLLALLKFVIPPVTNLPVGIFSVWHPDSLRGDTGAVQLAGNDQRRDQISAPDNASLQRREESNDSESVASSESVTSTEIQNHSRVTMRDRLKVGHGDDVSIDHSDFNESHARLEGKLTGLAGAPTSPSNLASVATDRPSMTVAAWLMPLHVLGSLIFAVALFWKARTLRRFMASTVPAPEAIQARFQELRTRLDCRSNIELRISPENVAPFSTGVFSPAIVVSDAQLISLQTDQLEAVLLHELVHHRRHDLFICWCQAIVTLFWWFHPAVWILNRQIRALREDCCDDFLICRNSVEPGTYCETLLNVARGCNDQSELPRIISVSMTHGVHSLKSRFRRIMDDRQPRKARISMAGATGLLLAAVLFIPGMTKAVSRVDDSEANFKQATVSSSTQSESKAKPVTEDSKAVGSPAAVAVAAPLTKKTNVEVLTGAAPKALVAKWPESITVTVLDPVGKPIAGAKVIQTVDRPKTEFITNAEGKVVVPVPEDPSRVTYMSILVDAAPYVVFGEYWYHNGRRNAQLKRRTNSGWRKGRQSVVAW